MPTEPTTQKELDDMFDEQVELFDAYVCQAVEEGCLEEFMESYINLRDAGMTFANAFINAAEERDVVLKDEKDDEDEKDEDDEIDKKEEEEKR